MKHAGAEPFPTIYMDGKEEGKVKWFFFSFFFFSTHYQMTKF